MYVICGAIDNRVRIVIMSTCPIYFFLSCFVFFFLQFFFIHLCFPLLFSGTILLEFKLNNFLGLSTKSWNINTTFFRFSLSHMVVLNGALFRTNNIITFKRFKIGFEHCQ